MSRVGRAPIIIPKGVTIDIQNGQATVKGPKGSVTSPVHPEIAVQQEDGQLLITRPSDAPRHRALHGLTRALLNNAVVGVSEGFTRVLELRGVGYRAEVAGKNLNMALGYSHPVQISLPDGVAAETTPSTPTMENGLLAATITLRSHDKQLLGDIASDIRRRRPVEPYKGKGLRYQGEVVRRKLGKAAKGDKKK
jgi:large subunit ribosomal protein L6